MPPTVLPDGHADIFSYLHATLAKRIMMIDGAMGTMIQRHRLTEEDYRGERFKDWPSLVKGNNDLLVLTQPEIILNVSLSGGGGNWPCTGWGAHWAGSAAPGAGSLLGRTALLLWAAHPKAPPIQCRTFVVHPWHTCAP